LVYEGFVSLSLKRFGQAIGWHFVSWNPLYSELLLAVLTEPVTSDFDMVNIGIDFFLNSHDMINDHLVITVDLEGRGQNKAIKVELEKEALPPKNHTCGMGERKKLCFSA
jgi:hypothetical protein